MRRSLKALAVVIVAATLSVGAGSAATAAPMVLMGQPCCRLVQ